MTKNKTENNLKNTIQDLSVGALEALSRLLNDPDTDIKDKLSAAKTILDISGIKNLKPELPQDFENTPKVKYEVSEKKIEKVLKKLDGLADE